MSLQNVQAQLGNLLAAMPLKVQKVDSSFLSNSNPPFEGAIVSDAQGQFYVSQINSEGSLAWQQILDKTSTAEVSTAEFVGGFDLPVGFHSASVAYGKTLDGDLFSVFVQYEPPAGSQIIYGFSVENVTSTGFDLRASDVFDDAGGKIHVFARGYSDSGGGSIVGIDAATEG